MSLLRALLIAWFALAAPLTAVARSAAHVCGNAAAHAVQAERAEAPHSMGHPHADHDDASPIDHAAHSNHSHGVHAPADDAQVEHDCCADDDCCAGGNCAGHACAAGASPMLTGTQSAALPTHLAATARLPLAGPPPDPGHRAALLRPPA